MCFINRGINIFEQALCSLLKKKKKKTEENFCIIYNAQRLSCVV